MSSSTSLSAAPTPGALIAKSGIPVSEEQEEKLALYQARLLHWQKAINLVATSTLGDSARRHFLDSAQIVLSLPMPSTRPLSLVDLGSGAGFPGLVLAILRPDLDVHLVEADAKKCAFLQTVSRETHTPLQIYNGRIEDVWHRIDADLITARALSTLSLLFGYSLPWFLRKSGTQAFFLKGSGYEREIEEARTRWRFDAAITPSLSAAGGAVVLIRNLCASNG